MKKITFLLLCFLCFIGTNNAQNNEESQSTTNSNSFSKSLSIGFSTSNAVAGSTTRRTHGVVNQNRVPVTITHSVTQTNLAGNSVTCNAGGIPDENSFFRDFDLAGDFGIPGVFTVTDVEFGVDTVTGPVDLTLNIYSMTGTFPADFGAAVLQGTATYTADVGDAQTIISVPLAATIPAGERMIYEYRIDLGAVNSLFPASNDEGQTDPSYIQAAACGLATPGDLAGIGFPDQHMVMNVVGDDGMGGGGCPIASDCNLMDTTPDDATSPNIWDRPIGAGPNISGLGPVSYDVYGPFTVDTAGNYTFDSVQTGWDGYLHLYETCFDPLDQLTGLLAGDDDGPGGIGTSQILDFPLVTGTEYYLITSGFAAGDFGDFTNTITGPGAVTCGTPPVDNDTCADATPVACGDIVMSETITNTDTGGNAAPDEWFSFTGTGTPEFVTISLCDGGTDYDSLLRVFEDCTLANELATNDDFCGLQSELTFTSDGVSTYYIMVEGFGSNSGNFSLEVSCALIPPPPPNDLCADAIAINCGDTVMGTTLDATIDDAVAPFCDTGVTSPGVWYVYTDTTGLVTDITLTTCSANTDYDTKISVYSGDCGAPPLTCIAGNDDDPNCAAFQSSVEFQSDGASTYYILVHGFGGGSGNFELNMSCIPVPPPNDLIANAIDGTNQTFPVTDPAVAMPAATLEGGNPMGCSLDGANGVWYKGEATFDGTVTGTIITPGGASSVIFYAAPDLNAVETDLVLVDWFENQCVPGTTATIPVLTGDFYYAFVLNTGAITDIVFDYVPTLGIGDNAIEGFTYFPNPSESTLNLSSVDTIENVVIFNMLGQKIVDQNVDSTTSVLDISNLTSGAYILKVWVNGQIGTYKILKK